MSLLNLFSHGRLAGLLLAALPGLPAWASQTPSLQFYPLTPCRVADTRAGSSGPIVGGSSRNIPLFAPPNQPLCGVPPTAVAYSLNITALPLTGSLGNLTVWATGQPKPGTSTLNSANGDVRAAAAIVSAGTAGQISLFVSNDAHVLIDMNGYFALPGYGGLQFYPMTPCRVVDTRGSPGPFAGPSLAAYSQRDFPLPTSPCGIPGNAAAYSLNLTALPSGPSLGWLNAWQSGWLSPPATSVLNSPRGNIMANAAIVDADSSGSISVMASDPTNVLIDIDGYFAPPGPGGLEFHAIAPCRVADTRGYGFSDQSGLGTPTLPALSTRAFPLLTSAQTCGVPVDVAAYSLNLTAIPTSGPLGYLSAWGAGWPQPWGTSTLNSGDGLIAANAAIVPVGAGSGGAVDVYVTNATDLLIDLNGYFKAPGQATGPQLSGVGISPSSGSGPYHLTFTISDTAGAAAVNNVQMLLNWSIDGTYACYVSYVPAVGLNVATDRGGWLNPVLPGNMPPPGGELKNGQCTVDPFRSSVTPGTNSLAFDLYVTFDPSFTGTQTIYLYARDNAGETGLQQVGTATFFPASPQLPSATINPSDGGGMSARTFFFSTTDVNSYKYVASEQLTFTATGTASLAHTCTVLFLNGANLLYLRDDNDTTWGNPLPIASPVEMPTSGTLPNSQCTIDTGNSRWIPSGNTLTLDLAIAFTSGFVGDKRTYALMNDKGAQTTGYGPPIGSWTVGADPPDFTITANPTSVTTTPGGLAQYTVTVTPVHGFAGSVTLNATNLPAGVSASPADVTLAGSPQLATMTLVTTTGTKAVTSGFTITGTSGTLSHNATPSPTVVVQDFSIGISPGSGSTTPPGGSATYTATVTQVNGFGGTVTLTALGLPSGATATFVPATLTGGGLSTLTINTTTSIQPGTYGVTVTGSSLGRNQGTLTSLVIQPPPITVTITPVMQEIGLATLTSFRNSDWYGEYPCRLVRPQ